MIKVVIATVAFVIMAGLTLAGGASATAATYGNCTAPLVDQTSEKVLDSAKVTSAVTAADKSGVDLYVRAFEKVPDGSLDAYWQDGVQKCANWRSGTGSDARPKGNVALIAFSLDRKSAIFYGPAYDTKIGDSNAGDVRSEMNGFFRNGDFTGGVTFAANRIGTLAASGNSGGDSAADPVADAPVDQAPASGNTSTVHLGPIILWTLGVMLVIALLVVCIMFALKVTRRRRENQRRLDGARKDALSARKTAGTYASKWHGQRLASLESETELDLLLLPESMQSVHRKEATRVRQLLNDGLDTFASVANTNVDGRGLTRPQYESARLDYESVNSRFTAAEAELASFRSSVKADVEAVDPAKQREKIAALADRLDGLAVELGAFTSAFTVSREKDAAATLKRGIDRTREDVEKAKDPVRCRDAITANEQAVDAFANDVTAMWAAYKRLTDPLGTMRAIVDDGRQRVRAYRTGNDKAAIELDKLEESLSGRLRFFGPDQDRSTGLGVFDQVQSQVDTIVKRAKKSHDENERKRQRDREVSLPRRRPSRSGSSGSDGFGGGFGGGFAGGFLGGSLGSGFGSSGSGGSSDSGSSWGGGSSGGFDGGSSSGGGDSGGW